MDNTDYDGGTEVTEHDGAGDGGFDGTDTAQDTDSGPLGGDSGDFEPESGSEVGVSAENVVGAD